MNLKLIILEILLALLCFILMEYLRDRKLNSTDQIIFPNIYMILFASLLPKLKDSILVVLILYVAIDLIYFLSTTKKKLAVDKEIYYKNLIFTFLLGFGCYHFFLQKVESAFLDMNIFKNFIWVLILLYFYQKLNLKSIKFENRNEMHFEDRYREYVITTYAKYKNKYGYLIKGSSEIENIIYSFFIYENYVRGNFYFLRSLKNKIRRGTSSYGVLRIEADHYITEEEGIVILKQQLEAKRKRLKDKDKEELLKKLIHEKYKETKDKKRIIKIISLIEEFNQ